MKKAELKYPKKEREYQNFAMDSTYWVRNGAAVALRLPPAFKAYVETGMASQGELAVVE